MTRLMRAPDPDVATYYSALSWLRAAWTTLPVAPKQLHDRDIEDGSVLGSHRYTGAFWAILVGGPYATEEYVEKSDCSDPIHAGRRGVELCPTCAIFDGAGKAISEAGTVSRMRLRYRSPMAAALSSLSRDVPPPPGRPSSIDIIVALAFRGWDLDAAAKAWGVRIASDDQRATEEARAMSAIRKLHSRYASAPIERGPRWTDLSESQRNAQDAA